MSQTYRILILDDSPSDAEIVRRELDESRLPLECRHASSREAFRQDLETFDPHLVLADYSLPSFSGPEALRIVREASLDLPFVLVSGSIGEEAAIDIIREGATDYVLKDRLGRLVPAVKRALEEAAQRAGRRSAELALAARAAELERSNMELQQFAYVCSHDLREPLRMITTFVELVEEHAEGLDDTARGHLKRVVEGALRMRSMVDGMLEHSHSLSGSLPHTTCDSSIALKAALDNLAIQVQESRATVVHEGLPLVEAHTIQLSRVFQNLVANAIKFNSTTPRVCVSAEERDGMWLFSVADNGIGIPIELRGRAFRMFQRLHTRNQYPGEGIGLTVCKGIVEHYGGTMWLDGNPGGGTIVLFTLHPAVQEAGGVDRDTHQQTA